MERGNQPEVYQYEQLPIEFRRQVVHIWESAITVYNNMIRANWWDSMHNELTRELGVFHLGRNERDIPLSKSWMMLVLN
jgi:hypothetical protein